MTNYQVSTVCKAVCVCALAACATFLLAKGSDGWGWMVALIVVVLYCSSPKGS